MSGRLAPNFEKLNGASITTFEAEAIQPDLLLSLRGIQNAKLRWDLPLEAFQREDEILRSREPSAYIESRMDWNTQAGHDGWNQNQLFRDPHITVVFDRFGQPKAAALTADNTSSTLPEPVEWMNGPLMRMKMRTPPSLRVPLLGGRKYVHLREAYEVPEYGYGAWTLAAIHRALELRHPKQQLAAYVMPGDPIDAEMAWITRVLRMRRNPSDDRIVLGRPGYRAGATQQRHTVQVGEAMDTIVALPGGDVVRWIPATIVRRNGEVALKSPG